MKCRGANALPPSIALWLEQQLELRGIDSVVYTRYILSLLDDETFDLNDLITYSKGNKKLSCWKSCNLEDLKRSAVIQCLTEAADHAYEIENLVDELCSKLKEAYKEGNKCLKEKTNTEDIFNLELPVSSLDLANKYYTAFPALTKGNSLENTFPLTTVWSRNIISRALGGGRKRGDSESSLKDNKVSKRKENKENVLSGGVNGVGRRMRSRSTVKQSSTHHRNRASTAKSLDRKEDEISSAMKRAYGATKPVLGSGSSGVVGGCVGGDGAKNDADNGTTVSEMAGDPRGRKCLNFMQSSLGQLIGYPATCGPAVEELMPRCRDEKLSRTPGRRCGSGNGNVPKTVGLVTTEYYDSTELPLDFQELLTSPSDVYTESSLYKQHPQTSYSGASSGNFIQCGTNITSSIWSDTSEKMEEDESVSSGNWETVCNGPTVTGGSKWSDARGSILSSAWKLPFLYDKDVEGTSLAVNASSGSFYSFFDTNPNSTSFLIQDGNNFSEVGENNNDRRERDSAGEQEEDLLTSMRTHFRPIKSNDAGGVMAKNTVLAEEYSTDSGAAAQGSKIGVGRPYKDGSTFTDTPASPVKLDYKRSESGALYLVTTGEKYFEFKRTTPNYLPHIIAQQASQQLSFSKTNSTFVPKFKVRQNEKFCQTDITPSVPLDKDFFFPGDERFAEEMLNGCCEDVGEEEGIEEIDEWFEGRKPISDDEQPRQTIQVSGWVTAWPIAMDSSAAIWASAAGTSGKAWICSNRDDDIKNGVEGLSCIEDCRMDDRNEHYLRLKDELSEEGEELLSDLSSIHLFLDPERMDEPNPHLKAHCTKNFEMRQCPIQPGNLSRINENFF